MTDRFRLSEVICILAVAVFALMLGGCGGDNIVDNPAKKEQKATNNRYTWMTINLPWDGSFHLPLINKTHDKTSEEPEINLDKNSSYTIYAALGSVDKRIYNVVAIKSNGNAIAAYKDPDTYKIYQKKFTLTPAELTGLTNTLIKNNAGKMLASSVDPEEKGGTQGGFTIISHQSVRRSYFSNSWPRPLQNIIKYINNDILRYSVNSQDNGFTQVNKSILTVDPEATFAIRGLLNEK